MSKKALQIRAAASAAETGDRNSVPPSTPFSNIPSGDLIAQELMGENKTAQLLFPVNRLTECTTKRPPRSIEVLWEAVIVQNFLEDSCFDLNTKKTESNDSSPEPPDHREAVHAQSLPPSALGDFPFCGARGGVIWKSGCNFETCTQTPAWHKVLQLSLSVSWENL